MLDLRSAIGLATADRRFTAYPFLICAVYHFISPRLLVDNSEGYSTDRLVRLGV